MSASNDIPSPQTATLDSASSPPAIAPSSSRSSKGDGPLDGIPALVTMRATTTDARVEALGLVADSVAQQRSLAARALIVHPGLVGFLVATLAAMARFLYHDGNDLPLIGTAAIAVIAVVFVTVRWAVSGYVALAEAVKVSWLEPQDDVLVTWFGDEAIGTVVVRWAASTEGKKSRRKGKRGLVRAWTVSQGLPRLLVCWLLNLMCTRSD